MPSDELRAAVEQDEDLRALLERLQVGPDGTEMLVQAVATGNDELVINALRLSPDEAHDLAFGLYMRATAYAERFPELRDAASFFGDQGSD